MKIFKSVYLYIAICGYLIILAFQNCGVSQKSMTSVKSSEMTNTVVYAPYCGDNQINQTWESCDGGESCLDTCQNVSDYSAKKLVLARVLNDQIASQGSNHISSDLFLGSKENRIPSGTWFALTNKDGSDIIDSSFVSTNEIHVPGLALERAPKSLKVGLFGESTSANSDTFSGKIQFSQGTPSDISESTLEAISSNGAQATGSFVTFSLTATSQINKFSANYTMDSFSQPNIVVIMTDDQDDRTVGYMKYTTSWKTQFGTHLKNNFSELPLCCPSRTVFLTGQCGHNNGIIGNSSETDGGYAKLQPTADDTLPVWMKNAGYTTSIIGKYLNGYEPLQPAAAPGWTNWQALVDTYKFYRYSIVEKGVIKTYGADPADYQTDVLASKAVEFLQAQKTQKKPFFLWLTPLGIHSGGSGGVTYFSREFDGGAVPPLRYATEKYDQPKLPNYNLSRVVDKPTFLKTSPPLSDNVLLGSEWRYSNRIATLHGVDDLVKSVVEALKANGQFENTVIIYTSDNGFFNGEHRRSSGKQWLYDEALRVPLMISGPGINKGQIRDHLISNLDLAPTIMDFAGAKTGKTASSLGRVLDGRSLRPILKDPNSPWRLALPIKSMDTMSWNTLKPGRGQGVRTKTHKYAEHAWFYDPIRPWYFQENEIDLGKMRSLVLDTSNTHPGFVKINTLLLNQLKAAKVTPNKASLDDFINVLTGLVNNLNLQDDFLVTDLKAGPTKSFILNQRSDEVTNPTSIRYINRALIQLFYDLAIIEPTENNFSVSYEMYDMISDPYEITNIVKSADPLLRDQLQSWTRRLSGCQGSACWIDETTKIQESERRVASYDATFKSPIGSGPDTPLTVASLSAGDAGTDVQTLNTFLSADRTLSEKPIKDPVYGKETEKAVLNFQKKHKDKLKATGIADKPTIDQINYLIKYQKYLKENQE